MKFSLVNNQTMKIQPQILIKLLYLGRDGINFSTIDIDNVKSEVVLPTNTGKGAKHDKSHITCYKCGEKGQYANESSKHSKVDDKDSLQLLIARVKYQDAKSHQMARFYF